MAWLKRLIALLKRVWSTIKVLREFFGYLFYAVFVLLIILLLLLWFFTYLRFFPYVGKVIIPYTVKLFKWLALLSPGWFEFIPEPMRILAFLKAYWLEILALLGASILAVGGILGWVYWDELRGYLNAFYYTVFPGNHEAQVQELTERLHMMSKEELQQEMLRLQQEVQINNLPIPPLDGYVDVVEPPVKQLNPPLQVPNIQEITSSSRRSSSSAEEPVVIVDASTLTDQNASNMPQSAMQAAWLYIYNKTKD